MRNDEIIERLNDIKRRAKSQKRAQCVTLIFEADGFVKMFDASGTVKKINNYTEYIEGSPVVVKKRRSITRPSKSDKPIPDYIEEVVIHGGKSVRVNVTTDE